MRPPSPDQAYRLAHRYFRRLFAAASERDKCALLGLKKELVLFFYSLYSGLELRPSLALHPSFKEWPFRERPRVNSEPPVDGCDTDELVDDNERAFVDKLARRRRASFSGAVLFATFDQDFHKYFNASFVSAFSLRCLYLSAKKRGPNVLHPNRISFVVGATRRSISFLYRFFKILRKEFPSLGLGTFCSAFTLSVLRCFRLRLVLAHASTKRECTHLVSSDLENCWGSSLNIWGLELGYKIIIYNHGSPTYFPGDRMIFADKYLCWGELLDREISRHHVNADIRRFAQKDLPKKFNTERFHLKGSVKEVALLTDMLHNKDLSFFISKEMIGRCMTAVIEELKDRHLRITLKSHKLNDHHSMYQEISSRYENVTHVSKRWYKEDVRTVDLAISFAPASTLNHQLHSFGAPVYYLSEIITPPLFARSILRNPNDNLYSTIDELMKDVILCLEDPEHYKRRQKESYLYVQGLHILDLDIDSDRTLESCLD